MSNSLYIAGVEPRSGKSLVALGVMEILSRHVRRLGFFRPIIRGGERADNDIRLMRSRYHLEFPYEDHFAFTYQQARERVADGRTDELLTEILARCKAIEEACDFVLCEGTDYTGVSSAFEFDFNAHVANHLGCPLLVVHCGTGKDRETLVDFVRTTRDAFADHGCTLAAHVVNRVSPQDADAVRDSLLRGWANDEPVYVLPEAETLGRPTVGEIASDLAARQVYGDAGGLAREALHYKVAAMQLPEALEHLRDATLVITPGDRADIVVGTLATIYSNHFPKVAAILLTGGIPIAPSVRRLIDGLQGPHVPILSVDWDTYETAMRVHRVPTVIGPDNERKIATALGLFAAHIDQRQLEARIAAVHSTVVTPLMFEFMLVERAKARRQKIVLPEGDDERILRASEILLRRDVVDLVLLGQGEEIERLATALGVDLTGAEIVDPATSPRRDHYAETYYRLRQHKGVSRELARDTLLDVSYFGTLMVHQGDADGMVSGAAHTTAHTIRPALEVIRTAAGRAIVSSVFFMCLEDRVLVYGDCAINPNPNAAQLADIAISSAETALMFGIEPRVAMLSYSTGQSGRGQDVEKVREATRLVRQARPDLKVDGPIQYDAAIDASVAKKKLPESDVAGRATVFIFPDLNTGNNTYKAVQRSAHAVAIGPVLQGLKKPVNDLSRGCTVADIVNTVAITAVQAQQIGS